MLPQDTPPHENWASLPNVHAVLAAMLESPGADHQAAVQRLLRDGLCQAHAVGLRSLAAKCVKSKWAGWQLAYR